MVLLNTKLNKLHVISFGYNPNELCCGVQYFGDLVTCLWWDEIWLNEAFAVLYDYYGVNHVSPEWEMVSLTQTQQHRGRATKQNSKKLIIRYEVYK